MTQQTEAFTDEMLLEAFQKLGNEIGGHLREGKAYPINEKTLESLLGKDYDELINQMYLAEYITPGIDEMKDNIFEIWFTSTGLTALKQRSKQIQEDKLATQRLQVEQATVDAKLLTQRFRPKKPDETIKATCEKLHELLGESTESTLEDRLDRLFTSKFCAANISGQGEYEITFFTKSVELAAEQEKPPRLVSRQKTVVDDEGVRHKIDLTNLRNYELLSEKTRPEDIETVARSYLWNMMHSKVKRVARGSQRELQHLLLLRGGVLPADLYQLANLRLQGFTGTYEGELPENRISKGQPWRATVSYEPYD